MRWFALLLLAATLVVVAPVPAVADNFSIRIGYDSGHVYYPPVYRTYDTYRYYDDPWYDCEDIIVRPRIYRPVYIYDRPYYRTRYVTPHYYRPYSSRYVVRPNYRYDHDRDWDRDRDHDRDWDRDRDHGRDGRDRDDGHDRDRYDRGRDNDHGRDAYRDTRNYTGGRDRDNWRDRDSGRDNWRDNDSGRGNSRVWQADSRGDSIRKGLSDDRGRSSFSNSRAGDRGRNDFGRSRGSRGD